MNGSTMSIVNFDTEQNTKYGLLSLVEFVEISVFRGYQTDPKSVVGGPTLILRTGRLPLAYQRNNSHCFIACNTMQYDK